MKHSAFILLVAGSIPAVGQTHSKKDTTQTLDEVVVQSFQYHRPLKESPVALGVVAQTELNRFANTSVVASVNTIPGVRMEERSPGSYRFSVRGSSLRSPFGVRNVKFYWNGLPLTDGGGNTYLNLLDFDAFGRMEILKGPGASLYGAGTSGVVLINPPSFAQNQIQVSAVGGGFGLQRYQASTQVGNQKAKIFVNYAHQQADGYRQQSALRREAFNGEGKFSLSPKSFLQTSFFYTDLYYQTPGGLSLAQYNADPRKASTTLGNAVTQQAAVYNKTIYASSSFENQWSAKWTTRIGVYGSYTDFTNPAISNYKRESDQNLGGRLTGQYEFSEAHWKGKVNFGMEYQSIYSPITNYANLGGVRGALQTNDQLSSHSAIAFAQIDTELPRHYFFTLGWSTNFLTYRFNRLAGNLPGQQQRHFEPVLSPRLALLKKINENFSLFTSVSKGFSAPSLAEVLPSSRIYNNSLSPEQGINYEIGIRGKAFKRFLFDVVGYDFELTQAIVDQKNNSGADYFINAGNTSQKGIEAFLAWQKNTDHTLVHYLKCWIAGTLTDYKFINYVYNHITYSGNQLTGSPASTVVVGIDVSTNKFYANLTSTYGSRIPLNNANTVYSSDYFLTGGRVGYKNQMAKNLPVDFFVGIDNALNQRYSLGNDLNAASGLYFNAAAARSIYFGIKMTPPIGH
ncbi:MAG: TonB-dependent receptor [Bacteroidetes bacterium]|nr:TonB-dependent receptor [Bacteroidota bacterium]